MYMYIYHREQILKYRMYKREIVKLDDGSATEKTSTIASSLQSEGMYAQFVAVYYSVL